VAEDKPLAVKRGRADRSIGEELDPQLGIEPDGRQLCRLGCRDQRTLVHLGRMRAPRVSDRPRQLGDQLAIGQQRAAVRGESAYHCLERGGGFSGGGRTAWQLLADRSSQLGRGATSSSASAASSARSRSVELGVASRATWR